jgi:adenosylmethionine-8-amino-7-oxononanoate aminotransferase
VTAHLWLPFTQMRDFDSRTKTFVRGYGGVLEDSLGNRVFDAVSSVWTIVHGHCHPRIVEAIGRQAATLDHATLLGASNPVAEELAGRLCVLSGMDRAFFASDGASAVEAAVKIAVQYWRNLGQPQRCRFIRLSTAYHGDTVGAMSVSDIALFKERFASLTFETRALDDRVLFEPDIAAVIVEPLVQAAAGMRLVDPGVYAALRDIEPLIIFDEIATGFGRTGTLFAFEQTGAHPDLVCLGKGLTGGALALSCTLARRRIYEAFLGDPRDGVHFLHGHSFAGNPIACAAALASLDLFDEEGTLERAERIASRAATHLQLVRAHPLVRETRQAGTMIGIELAAEATDPQHRPTPGRRIADRLYDAGHFTRPIGDVLQLVPPLCSTDCEIDSFFDALGATLEMPA